MIARLPAPRLLHRFTAAAGVLLVLWLTVLSASPGLHAWMHGDPHCLEHAAAGAAPVGEADHACAVTLFAQGVTALLVFCLLVLARPLARGIGLRAPDEIVVARPRYRLVPSHAPPAA